MTMLTADQIDHYKNKGYLSPISALTSSEAKEIRNEIEKIEKNWPGALEGINRNYCLLYTSPSPRDGLLSRMPSSA